LNNEKFGLSEKTIKKLLTIFQKYQGIKEVIIYGSRAKGNYRNGSDIDITLKTGNEFEFSHLLKLSGEFEDSDIPYLVDVSIYNELENPELKAHIDRVGKILYEA